MRPSRYRWFVVSTFPLAIPLHPAGTLLIGTLTTPIMRSFGIDDSCRFGIGGTAADCSEPRTREGMTGRKDLPWR